MEGREWQWHEHLHFQCHNLQRHSNMRKHRHTHTHTQSLTHVIYQGLSGEWVQLQLPLHPLYRFGSLIKGEGNNDIIKTNTYVTTNKDADMKFRVWSMESFRSQWLWHLQSQFRYLETNKETWQTQTHTHICICNTNLKHQEWSGEAVQQQWPRLHEYQFYYLLVKV